MRQRGASDGPDGVRSAGGVRNEVSGTVAGSVVMAGSIGVANIHVAPAERVVPRQLAPLGAFENRSTELAAIDRGFAAAVGLAAVVVLWGPGGVGKTALALRWLHATQDRFPGGHLSVDLGGGTGTAMEPEEALAILLRGLGVAPEVLPADLQERIGLYQSLVAARPVAVLLENAVTAAQVRPLLPAVAPSVALVTSRSQLSGLRIDAAAVYVAVEPLDEEAAVGMLRRMVGAERLDRDVPAARRLARLCGLYPLVLSIAGARLACRAHWSVAAAADELVDGRDLLVGLTVPGDDRSVARALDTSYGQLPADTARVYRIMGLHPTPEFALAVAAAATDLPAPVVETALGQLREQGLLVDVDLHRYRFHDVLWLDAAARAAGQDAADDLYAAVLRIVTWYAWHAAAADLVITPRRWRVGPIFDEVAPGASAIFPDKQAARGWFKRERANLVAATALADRQLRGVAGRAVDEAVAQLSIALWTPFFADRDYEAWLPSHTAGIAAAVRLGDDLAASKLYSQRGFAYLERGEPARAAEDFTEALRHADTVGDAEARSTAMESLGLAALGQKHNGEALDFLDRALAVAGSDPRRLGLLAHHRGRALSGLDRFAEALASLEDAVAVMREIGDRYNEGRVLTSIGIAYRRAGRRAEGTGALRAALDIMREEPDAVFQRAEVAVLLAEDGPADTARAYLIEARDAYEQLGAAQAAKLDERIAAMGPDQS